MQEKLIILRKQRNITQKEIADLIGITTKQYSLKENGNAKFNGDEMFKIADFFKMQIDSIFLPTTHQNGEYYKKLIQQE